MESSKVVYAEPVSGKTKISYLEKKIAELIEINQKLSNDNTRIKNSILSDVFYKSLKKKLKHINNIHDGVLIGLDGKIKKIYKKDTDLNMIFSDIDKMPMRINKMKDNY